MNTKKNDKAAQPAAPAFHTDDNPNGYLWPLMTDDLEPQFYAGDQFHINPDAEIENGDWGLFRFRGRYYIRQIYDHSPHLIDLQAPNKRRHTFTLFDAAIGDLERIGRVDCMHCHPHPSQAITGDTDQPAPDQKTLMLEALEAIDNIGDGIKHLDNGGDKKGVIEGLMKEANQAGQLIGQAAGVEVEPVVM